MSFWKTLTGDWKTPGVGDPTTTDQGPIPVQIRSSAGAAQDLGKAEDSAHVSGDTGVQVLGVRVDDGSALTSANGDYSPLSVDGNSQLRVALSGGAGGGGNQGINSVPTPGLSDGINSATYIGFSNNANLFLYNGVTWDRHRGNEEGTALVSAARTAAAASADITVHNHNTAVLYVNVTANPGGAETLGIAVDAKDPVSGVYMEILNITLFTASNGSAVVMLGKGATESPATMDRLYVYGYPVGRKFRVRGVPSAAGSWTYSIGYCLVV